MNDSMDEFWDEQRSVPEKLSDDERKHIEEVATVPQTQRGPLRWRKEDDELCGAIPEPLSRDDSSQRIEYITERTKEIWSQNKRADFYLLKNLNGFRLLQFDRLPESDQKTILDRRHAMVDDIGYRKHRTELHQIQSQAESTLKKHRSDLESYMKLPPNCQLSEHESHVENELYSWLLYQLNFDSTKWLVLPRSYNRPKMMTEVMIRLFVDCYFVCTFLTAEQIQQWTKKNLVSWRTVLLEKDVVFIAVRKKMPVVFWDMIFEDVQRLVTSGKSVVFVSDKTASDNFPSELREEYLSVARPQNVAFCRSMKLDRTTFEFCFTARMESHNASGQVDD
jgi:hypothetical protein